MFQFAFEVSSPISTVNKRITLIFPQLGLIWCLREDYEKASEFLETSLDSFNAFVQGTISNEKCIYEPEDLLSDEETLKENPPFYHQKTKILDQV
jgi:hypothetical protein